MNQTNLSPNLQIAGGDISNSRVAYIEAGWHNDIVSQARASFTEKLKDRGITNICLLYTSPSPRD